MRMHKNISTLFIGLLLLSLLSGCGLSSKQVAKTKSFGSATETIGKLGEEELLNIRNGVIKMNENLIAVDSSQNLKVLNLDRGVTVEKLEPRLAAIKALNAYGLLLVELVNSDRTDNLQKAASSLVENTTLALNTELTEEQDGIINKIIVGLGSFWVEKKKADAAREIIPAYEDPVNQLADLLINDFTVSSKSNGLLLAYHNTASNLRNSSLRYLEEGDKHTILERDRALEIYLSSIEAISYSDEISKKTGKTLLGLKKANSELVEVIKDEYYSKDDIKSYGKQVQDLANMIQIISIN